MSCSQAHDMTEFFGTAPQIAEVDPRVKVIEEKIGEKLLKLQAEQEAALGIRFTKDELAILSKLLRGHVVGPEGRKVLDKVHNANPPEPWIAPWA